MMELSTKGRYATRIMVALALHNGSQPAKKKEIAETEGISPDYVEQILMQLRHAGLVTSYRGAKGGFALARAAESITVVDVIEVMEGPIAVAPCKEDNCDRISSCVTRAVWDQATDALRRVFAGVTIGAIAEQALERQAEQALSFHI